MRDARKPRRRLMVLLALVFLWSLAIVARMVEIQIYRADELRELASRQHSSTVELDPVRGTIVDRNGTELALSRDVQSIYAVPGLVESPEKSARLLASTLGIKRTKLEKRLSMTKRNFVWVARKVTEEQARAVEELTLPGIAFLEEPKRFYPKGGLAAHILGYVGLDNTGLAGIEQQFDLDIRGIPGVKLTMRDARGLRFLPEPGGHPAEPGRKVVLSIDATIQYIVERELSRAVEENRAKGGVVVVLDPWTGDVLAMAGAPSFDPNEYARTAWAARRNPAVQEVYEPGSTFKLVTMSAALENRRVNLDELLDCGNGSILVGGRRIADHKSFDQLTPGEVITYSSNVGAIVLGLRIPPESFYHQIRLYGFGRSTGIELPGEASGILRAPGDWSKLSRPMLSMGYEVGVTPLQLASVFAAIANGGTLMKPRVVLRVEEHDGQLNRASEPTAVRRVISAENASTITSMMENVVRMGTAKAAAIDGLTIAGKTGTAKKLKNGAYTSGYYVASFGGFAPSQNPRLAILVTIDEPRAGNYYGGLVAAPVAKRILSSALAVLGVPAEGRTLERAVYDYYPESNPASSEDSLSRAIAQR